MPSLSLSHAVSCRWTLLVVFVVVITFSNSSPDLVWSPLLVGLKGVVLLILSQDTYRKYNTTITLYLNAWDILHPQAKEFDYVDFGVSCLVRIKFCEFPIVNNQVETQLMSSLSLRIVSRISSSIFRCRKQDESSFGCSRRTETAIWK